MSYTVLLFLFILTITWTTSLHHCNSDAYSSASGMADLQQLTTLQYCLIDNCTIMRIDTGQQLDIVYTTQSHLVVTPTDGQTSMLISKNDPELFCSTPSPTDNSSIFQIVRLVPVTLIGLVSGYIVVVHMMFKEIRGTFGKLLMLYNSALVCQCFSVFPLSITHYNVTVNSTMPCYLFNFLFMQFGVVDGAFATSFLAYLVYIIYQSYRSRRVTKEINKQLYKQAIRYVLGLSLLFGVFVVSYDFGTGTYEHTLLPNGHCSFFIQSEYNTIRSYFAFSYLNEIIQILLLLTYFIYYYRLNKKLEMVHGLANIDIQQNQFFFKIAVTMAATIGISQILFASSWYFDSGIAINISGWFFVMQQCVIMSLFMCSKKVKRLCRERFCTVTEVSPM